jgi:hypothetical protein
VGNEIVVAEQYIYGKLAALVGGRVYSGIAPATATYPLIVFQVQSPGADVTVIGGERIWADPLFLVRAVGKSASWSSVSATADAIDVALHNTSGGAVVWCRRESPFSLIEVTDAGIQYRHLGGLYRLRVLGE